MTWTPFTVPAGSAGARCVEARTGRVEPALLRAASNGARVDPVSKTTTALGCSALRPVQADDAPARASTTKVVAVTVRPAERAALRNAAAPSAATLEPERTRATRSRCCRLAAATSTPAWSAIDDAMGKVSGNSLGLKVAASAG